jgi:hypothetical protein
MGPLARPSRLLDPEARREPQTGPMASRAVLTIRVTAARGSSRIQYSTNGRYVNLATNAITDTLAQQPIQPTSSAQAFWASVIAIVAADIAAGG